jgi:hypothetical protein
MTEKVVTIKVKIVPSSPSRARRMQLMPIAKRLRREGHTLVEIARALGISLGCVHYWLKGVPKGDIFA